MTDHSFIFNAARCTGCMACVVACQDQNDYLDDDTIAFRHVNNLTQGGFSESGAIAHSVSCQHCVDPPCLLACPMQAITRRPEDGTVIVDRDMCVGCYSCELACPIGAPQFPKDGRMAKCDLCYVRRDNGMSPACVSICPTGAIEFGAIKEIGQNMREKESLRMLESLSNLSDEVN